MEKNVMQNTKNTLAALKLNRKDLHTINQAYTPQNRQSSTLRGAARNLLSEGKKPEHGLETKHVSQKWTNNMGTMCQDTRNQVGLLSNQAQQKDDGTGNAGEGSIPIDYFDLMYERMLKEIDKLMESSTQLMQLAGAKSTQSPNELTSAWRSETQKLKQEMSNVLKGKEPIKQIALLMTLKDELMGQIFTACMYRKVILFEDLSVNNDGNNGEETYASPKVVNIHQILNRYVEELGYKPPRLIYQPITVSNIIKNGIYTQAERNQADTAESLKDMIQQVMEMETLFQKQLLFTTEKKKQFYDSNPVQNSLRNEVQELKQMIDTQDQEQKRLQDLISKNDTSGREIDESTFKLSKLERELQTMTLERDELIRSKKDREAKIQELTRKYAIEKETAQQMRQVYQPKLKETILFQKDLADKFQQIREDTELLPSMFRVEANEKKRIELEFNKAQEQMRRAEREDASLRKQVENLNDEVHRKKRLAMQAIAARGQFKQTLNDYQEKIAGFEVERAKVNAERDECKTERDRYEQKHDEMFSAISGLNSRIEELEQHKLHLLQRLKKYGDKGDLSYIIKTQKLENVKGKEFEGRVVVEDYRPEELRKQRDAEFAAKQKASKEGGDPAAAGEESVEKTAD